jgi:hypothetical protein
MDCPGRILTDIIQLFGEIEWGRSGIIITKDDNWNTHHQLFDDTKIE